MGGNEIQCDAMVIGSCSFREQDRGRLVSALLREKPGFVWNLAVSQHSVLPVLCSFPQ